MSTHIAGRKSGLVWATHITVAALVIIWLVPTIGLLVSSFRDRDQISESGWWKSFSSELRETSVTLSFSSCT